MSTMVVWRPDEYDLASAVKEEVAMKTPLRRVDLEALEEAVRRLVQQEEPLTSVALDLGFSTPGNFSRFFREHMGVTPSRFRRAASGTAPHLLTGIS